MTPLASAGASAGPRQEALLAPAGSFSQPMSSCSWSHGKSCASHGGCVRGWPSPVIWGSGLLFGTFPSLGTPGWGGAHLASTLGRPNLFGSFSHPLPSLSKGAWLSSLQSQRSNISFWFPSRVPYILTLSTEPNSGLPVQVGDRLLSASFGHPPGRVTAPALFSGQVPQAGQDPWLILTGFKPPVGCGLWTEVEPTISHRPEAQLKIPLLEMFSLGLGE